MTRIITVDPDGPQADRIREAAEILRRGGLVAFPTETVYGLGANALDPHAVASIFTAKGRPASDPIILHIAHVDHLELVAREVPQAARELASTFWPGALTIVLPKGAAVSDSLTAGLPTVAIRVPSHPIALALIRAAGVPVAAPSANRFSRPSPTCADHVLADLGDRIDLIIDGGPTTIGVESTIVDLTVTPPVIRRPGGVSQQQLQRVIPDVRMLSDVHPMSRPQPAPGQLLRHYAPRAAMTLYVGSSAAVSERVANDVRAAVAAGRRVGVLAPEEDLRALAPRLAAVGATGRVLTVRCGSRSDREEAARDLFRAIRDLDREGVDLIYATAPEGEGINAAIIDRLTRAAENRVHRIIE